MTWMKENKIFVGLVLVLSCVCLFFIGQKQGFHEDEIFSYGSSNYKYDNVFRSYGYAQANYDYLYTNLLQGDFFTQAKNFWNFLFHSSQYETSYDPVLKAEVPTWQDKEQALKYLTIQKEDTLNFFSVWFNQLEDVHPPLFYFLVHIFSCFTQNHFTKYTIFFLNLFFFIGTLYILYKIILFFAPKKWANLAVFFYGISMGAISTVMFQRMYMMLTFFTLFYLYYSLKFLKEKNFTKKDFFLWGMSICLGFLTQYYFAIFAVILFLVLAGYFIKKKEYSSLKKMFLVHAIGAFIGILIFPSSIEDIFFSYRGIGGGSDRTKSTLEMLLYFLNSILHSFSIPIWFFLLFIFLGIGYVIWNRKKLNLDFFKEKTIWILIIPIFLVLLIVSKMSPFLGEDYTSRYVMFLLPILVITIIYLLSRSKNQKIFIGSTLVILFLSGFGLLTEKPTYLYEKNEKVLALAEEYQEDSFIYIYDNYFTHLSSLPEFLTYQKTLILNHNIYDFSLLQKDEYLNSQTEVILCIKNWLNTEELLNKVLENTHFTEATLLLSIKEDINADYYKLTVS